MTDILERLRLWPHIPVSQLRAYASEIVPLAITEIELLRQNAPPTPAPAGNRKTKNERCAC